MREEWGVEIGKHVLRLTQAPDKNGTPNLKIPRMRRVDAIAVRFKSGPSRAERLRRPGQVARGKRDLGFSDDAPGACDGFFRPEGARRLAKEFLRSYKLSQLCHRDPAKSKRRRIVTH